MMLQTPRDSPPADHQRPIIALVATLVLVLALEAVRTAGWAIPSPAALLFVVLVFATIYGGNLAGAISALAACAYYIWFYLATTPPWMGDIDLVRVILLCVGSFGAVGTIAAMRHVLAQRERARFEAAQRSLTQTEARYRLLFDSIRDPIVVYPVGPDGRPGRMVAANDAAVELYGYSREQLLQKTVLDIVHPSVEPSLKIAQVLQRGDMTFVSKHLAADGRVIPVEVRAHRFELDGGPALLSIARDVTERRRVEAELRRERDFIATVLNTVGSVVVVLDRHGRIVQVNRAAQQISGYAIDELLEQRVWDRLVPEEERGDVQQVFASLLRTGQANAVRNHWVTRKGDRRLLEWSNTVVLDEQQQVQWVIGTAIDITERHQAERELDRYREQLEQRVRERTLQLARTNRALTDEVAQREAAQQRLRQAHAELVDAEQRERQRLAQVLHDHLQQLLAAARMRVQMDERASARPAGQVLDLLDEAIALSRSLAVELSPPVLRQEDFAAAVRWLADHFGRQQHLQVQVAVTGQPAPIEEPVRVVLFQGLRELLFNVVKHGRADRCDVELAFQPEQVSIRVRDEGRGFDPDQIAEGRGFGHAHLADRLRVLGGSVRIDSAVGRGTTVTLEGPVAAKETAPLPSEAVSALPTDGGAGRVRIAIADDHRLFRAGLIGLLRQRAEVEVVGEAGNGRDILGIAREQRPDVVLMDVNMPGMNGIDATAALKRDLPHVRVIGLSMHREPDVAQRMHDAGAEAYVVKDGPPEELLATILDRPDDIPVTPR